jgi:hypothetical protein
MNSPDHISESLETIFGLKYFKSLMRIRDGKNSDPGWEKFRTEINIPDPQHWIIHVRLCVVGEAVVHSRSPTDSLCLEDAELPYDQVGYLSPFCFFRMFILDPQHSWSPDLKQQQKTGEG